MRVTTITEARALVGWTFERDGKRRTVVGVQDFGFVLWDMPLCGRWRSSIPKFSTWLSGATEVVDG